MAQTPPDPRFGAVEAFNDSASAVEAGVAWDRLLFQWRDLQPNSPDEWYDASHVAILDQAAASGREVIGLLIRTPAWATDGYPDCGVPRGLELPVDDPNNLWAAFVRRAVGTYNGRINHWIIWNEPDIGLDSFGVEWCGTVEEYYRLVQVAYLAAHEVNPNAVIHLGALTFWHDRNYLRRFLAVATQDPGAANYGYYFDVVTLHIYFQTETVPYIINETRAALRAYGVSKPVWVNETNAAANIDPGYWELPEANFQISLDEQAGFLLQGFALALSAGAQRIAVYRWVDHPFMNGVEPNGIVRLDGSRRPAYDAYRLITTHYAGTQSAQESRQALYYQVTLNRGAQTTRVLWARTAATVTVSLPASTNEGLLIDQAGAMQAVQPSGGYYTLVLPGARCADSRGCIIGGRTFLLVEGGSGTGQTVVVDAAATPTPTTEPAAEVSAQPTVTPTLPLSTPTVPPTLTPTPTPTETPSPTCTPTPTPTSTPTPTPTLTPTPTTTPLPPTPTPTLSEGLSNVPPWLVLAGLMVVLMLALASTQLTKAV
ncbi:MAG: hypothetical protein JXD18_02280 [Anaerolineae bacterium]|nr:hypothetical protein [Anaerolineae bacterium]